MYLAYGNHKHAVGECRISIDRATLENAAHVPIAVHEAWSIEGMLVSQAANPATDMDAQISSLMAAYSSNGGDLILYMPDGVTPSSSALISSKTLGGTRVTQQPSFVPQGGAERICFTHFSLKVEAELPVVSNLILTEYHESLKLTGGVPAIGWLEPAVGPPVQQIWKQFTTFKAIQDGSAVGYQTQPLLGVAVGVPLFPIATKPQMTSLDAESPERIGGAYKNFKVTWHYEFESDTPLVGQPTPWPLAL